MTTTAVKCLHDVRGECWLCSDAVPWWKEARLRAGLGEAPPHQRRQAVEAVEAIECFTIADLRQWYWETYGRRGDPKRVLR